MSVSNETIESIVERLTALEKAVFTSNTKRLGQSNSKKEVREYAGPTGGIRFLIDEEKYFAEKRNLSDVRFELERHNYHYSRQAIHTALRMLSKIGGPLVTLSQGGKKVYVERK